MYDPKPTLVGDRLICVNSQPEDPQRPRGPEHYRAENWPKHPGHRLNDDEKAAQRAQALYGQWRPTLQEARDDAQAWIAQLLQEAKA